MRTPIHSLVASSLTILCLPLAFTAKAQSDVTQPGDPIIASSANSPGSEGGANAIDNTQAKYLNFDTRTQNGNPPSGFIVSPSVGVTRVIGMTITSANDAPERDPSTILLEGSNDAAIGGWNDPTNTWVVIAGLTNIPAFTARFQKQTFFFDNFKPYRHYRWTVVAVATPNTCCMQVAEVELLGSTLPPDVTQPGDAVIASSANSPGSEGGANAIDNTQAKYLNFDTRTQNGNPPSGFAVTPSIGRSLVTGMTIQSANDAPERDPSTVILEGSNDAQIGGWNDPTNTWELVVGLTNIPAFTTRFQTQTFLFDNFKPYRHYRWTVVAVATPNTCCMQVAEVELLGTGAPKDVTQPGDPVVASSANSPGSEGGANAIDNTQAKYLNFDTRTQNGNPPSGFVVSPAVGETVVTGMTIQSANDAPERDPSTVLLEGSNDAAIGGWNDPTNTWEVIVGLTNIPAFATRFQTQEFFFANKKAFKHYRWTVVAVATPNTCCMQVAEVELLAATQSNPCGQTEFTLLPVNTPVLDGTPATFVAKVNGPWTVQWLLNGVPIPGANTLNYTTPPVTSLNATNLYAVAIVGCQTSSVVKANIFAPSATKSIAVNFIGGGANGAPTAMDYPNDIGGVQLQAYWNNATNATGASGDGFTMGPLVDSDNQPTVITFDYFTAGTWGAGTGVETPTERMLNGLVGDEQTLFPGTFNFNNVPAGNHSLLIYAVSPPLQFQRVSFTVTGTTTQTNYLRTMNSDEYKVAPGFYRGTSTDPNNPAVANFVRFDGIQPDASGIIKLDVQTLTPGVDRETGVNGLQLVLNTVPVPPPIIASQPQPTVAASNATARLSVVATGTGLTYQWRKNGKNLLNAGNVSGANSANLAISSFAADDVGIYSVVVFDQAGNSVVSQNASVRLSTYNILDSLVAHWKLDETSGTNAANAIASGRPGSVYGTATWGAGRIANAFALDGASYLFVSNYTKASKQMAAAAWVNLTPGSASDMAVVRNDEGPLDISGGAGRIIGQFELGLVYDVNDGLIKPMGAVGLGPNVARATGASAFSDSAWHHLAFTADGAQVRLYVDGQQVATTDYLGDINPPDVPWISIGSRLVTDTNAVPPQFPDPAAPNFLVGQLDDIGVWTRALTADEVLRIYQAGQQGQSLNTVIVPQPAPDRRITGVTIAGGNVTVTWEGGGTLFTSSSIGTGAVWTTTGDSDGSYTAPRGPGNLFFRVQGP